MDYIETLCDKRRIEYFLFKYICLKLTIVFDTLENVRWKYWVGAIIKCIPNDLELIA